MGPSEVLSKPVVAKQTCRFPSRGVHLKHHLSPAQGAQKGSGMGPRKGGVLWLMRR